MWFTKGLSNTKQADGHHIAYCASAPDTQCAIRSAHFFLRAPNVVRVQNTWCCMITHLIRAGDGPRAAGPGSRARVGHRAKRDRTIPGLCSGWIARKPVRDRGRPDVPGQAELIALRRKIRAKAPW